MKWRIISALAGFVIIGLPMLALNLGALGRMAQVERAVSGGETSVPGPIADLGIGIDGLYGDVREKQRINALFDTEAYVKLRHVTFTEVVEIEDVLRDGEATPDPALHRLYVVARAPQRAMEHCPLLLENLARGCKVAKIDVDERSKGDFKVETRLSYLPAYDPGTTKVEGPTDLYDVSVDLPRASRDARLGAPAAAARKAEVIKSTLAACDALRSERGNCVVERITFDERRLDDRKDLMALRFSARLKWVGPRAEGADNTMIGNVVNSGSTGPEESAARVGLFQRLTALFRSDRGQRPEARLPVILRGEHQRYGGDKSRFIKIDD